MGVKLCLAFSIHIERSCPFTINNDPVELLVDKVNCRPIGGGIPGGDGLFSEHLPQEGFALGFGVVVGGEAAGEPAEAGHDLDSGAEGIGGALLEPDIGTGGDSGEDGALVVGFAEDGVDSPGLPEEHHVHGAASANEDEVLIEQHLFRGAGPSLGSEELEDAGFGAQAAIGGFELGDVVERVSAGGGDEADFRFCGGAEGEEVLVEEEVFQAGAEASAAEGDDLAHRKVLPSGAVPPEGDGTAY